MRNTLIARFPSILVDWINFSKDEMLFKKVLFDTAVIDFNSNQESDHSLFVIECFLQVNYIAYYVFDLL